MRVVCGTPDPADEVEVEIVSEADADTDDSSSLEAEDGVTDELER